MGALLLFLLILPGFIDWNEYRAEISEQAAAVTGRQVSIEGDISARILPSPALSVADVRISNSAGGSATDMLQLDSLDINVRFLPLLSGDISISSFSLVRPTLVLEQMADGRTNWEFEEAGGDETTDVDEAADDSVSLDLLEIENGTVIYIDHFSDKRYEVTNINLAISAKTLSGPFEVSGELAYAGVPLGIELTAGRVETDRRSPASVRVDLPGAAGTLEWHGTFTPGEALSVSGELKGEGNNFGRLVQALGKLGGDPQAQGIPQAFPWTVESHLALTSTTGELSEIDLEVGSSKFSGIVMAENAVNPRLTIALFANSFSLDDWITPNGAADGDALSQAGDDFELPRDLIADVTLNVEALDYMGGTIRRAGIDLHLEERVIELRKASARLPGGTNLSLSGRLRSNRGAPEFDGNISLASTNLRGFLSWLEVDVSGVPASQLGAASINGRVRATSDVVQLFGAEIAVDITKAKGGITIALSERPAFGVDLELDRLNVDRYLAGSAETASDDTRPWSERVDEIRASFEPLAAFDANIRLVIDRVTALGASMSGLEFVGELVDGSMTLERLQIDNFENMRISSAGRIGGLGDIPVFDLDVDVGSANLTAFARWADMELPMPASDLANIALKGHVWTDLSAVEFDVTGEAARASFQFTGSAGGLSPTPQTLKIVGSISHRDHVELFRRLALETGFEAAPGPISANFDVALDRGRYSGTLGVELLGGEFGFTGRFEPGDDDASFELTLNATHPDFALLVRSMGQDFKPSAALGPLGLDAQLTGTSNNFAFTSIAAQIGDLVINGRIAITRGEISTLNGNLVAGDLVLDDFMQSATAGVEQVSEGGERWSRQRLDLSGLNSFNGEIKVRADSLAFRDYFFDQPGFTLSLRDGVLRLEEMTSGLFGGELSASGALDARAVPSFSAEFELKGARSADAIGSISAMNFITGDLDTSGRIGGVGNSQFEMISSLEGATNIRISNGSLLGPEFSQVAALVNDLRAPQSGAGRLLSLARLGTSLANAFKGGQSGFRVIEADIDIAQGIATLDHIDNDLERARLEASGVVDLPQWTIDAGGEFQMLDLPDSPPIGFSVQGPINTAEVDYRTRPFFNYLSGLAGQNVFGTSPGADSGTAAPDPAAATNAPEPSVEEKVIKGIFDLLKKKKKKKDDGNN